MDVFKTVYRSKLDKQKVCVFILISSNVLNNFLLFQILFIDSILFLKIVFKKPFWNSYI